MKKDNFLHTPKKRIVIGEWMLTESGKLCLKVKKPKSNEYETISAIALQQMILLKLKETGS